jgi:hypothetical protein
MDPRMYPQGAATGTEYARLIKNVRTRFTIAEVNAGAVLLPAKHDVKYRVVDMALVAVGGAVGATTTVDILATQAAASVKLLAAAIANLTQNSLLRAGATGATILAAGVSFVANDKNTAITVGKTGATATTATHVDVLVSYVEER